MKVLERKSLTFVPVGNLDCLLILESFGIVLISLFIPPTFPLQDVPYTGVERRWKACLFIP